MSARRLLLVATLAALSVAVISIIIAERGRSARPSRILEIEMAASAGTFAQIFWGADQNFAEERSFRVPLPPTPGRFHRLRFPLPSEDVPWLRFDPIDTAGEVLIRRARVLDSKDEVLAALGPESFRPLNHIASVTRAGEVTRVVTTPKSNDSSLLVAFGCLDRSSLWG